ncbi:dephospho-CoA kinase [Cryptosporangium aurantiacum]|uniref:Dephospho-CoA kinase n=1 Tax=Cryptosporangium aurantiacum TaxID=134849 RepID=A0A1M7IFU0_9ACTN|nr:dephospho-CoA kinase [Cryptosporangium aurantiacum]SHM39468.1 dephospho-CoA kinase [Cryptosporangium aurantiacum]
MLRIGLTGGIGAGKSAAATALAEQGAVVIDADRLAREVVEPGTAGLAAVVEAFGTEVLAADGTLDRPKLGRVVFGDDAARARLNGILHPLIGTLTAERVAAAPSDGVVVHDIPLIVEGGLAAGFHLAVVVMAPEDVRIERLTGLRGMPEEDARARIAVQATDEQRAAAADVLLDNAGPLDRLRDAIAELWELRLAPYAAGLAKGVPAPLPSRPGPVDPTWPAQYARAAARLRTWLHRPDLLVEHVGPTEMPTPGATVPDVLDLRVVLPDAEAVRSTAGALAGSGWIVGAEPYPDGATAHSADPGRPARLFLAS